MDNHNKRHCAVQAHRWVQRAALKKIMNLSFQPIEVALKSNIEDVYHLAEFDHVILSMAIDQLRVLEQKLNKDHFIDNPQLTAANTRINLENIRANDSLRPRFEVINNQCVVLLVSLFASAVGDLYRSAIRVLAQSGKNSALNNEELKFTVGEIMAEESDLADRIGRLVEEKKDISFQDMKSIARAFGDYFDAKIEKDATVNNLILAQAGRHLIVHDGAIINDRFNKQIRNAVPRNVLSSISTEGKLLFTSAELKIIGNNMIEYFAILRSQVECRLNNID